MKNTYELTQGLTGSGHASFIVEVFNKEGKFIFQHSFETKEEAINWMKWA
jgi:hypothetical protein